MKNSLGASENTKANGNAWDKTKTIAKNGWNKTKQAYSNTKKDWKEAYSVGYSQAWKDYEKISTRFGSRISAALGYAKGLRNRHKCEKYQKKVKR